MGDDDLRRELGRALQLHRRRFLGLLAGGTGAVLLGACSSSGGEEHATDGNDSDRSSTTAAPTIAPDEVPTAEGIDGDPFLLGVASGDPDATSVVLWTKLLTDLVDPSGQGGLGDADHAVRWEVA
ncbi:MAG: PhoD-like phosphatase N-terminal domain-containing protein, partial [Acidimicrobiales bacterium]|nr:PhoD-like phosphatase N-terminal domain-containing protein [Acidimicrobiales bacterium]